jgi:hypothetical protein
MDMEQIRVKTARLRHAELQKIVSDLVGLRFVGEDGFVDPHRPLTLELVSELLSYPDRVFSLLAGGTEENGKRPKARRR